MASECPVCTQRGGTAFLFHTLHCLFKGLRNERKALDQTDHTTGRNSTCTDIFDVSSPEITWSHLGNRIGPRENCLCICTEQCDGRHQYKPAQCTSGQHIAGNLRSADVTDTCQCREYLDSNGRTGIGFDVISNLTWEDFQSVCDKFVSGSDSQTGEYRTCFASAFFSGKKNFWHRQYLPETEVCRVLLRSVPDAEEP